RAVHRPGVVLILREHRAIEVDAGEQPLAARIGQELGVELPVGTGLRISAHRTSRRSGISTNLELVLQHVLKTLLVHSYEHQIRRLSADLEAEAASSKLD